MEAGSRYLINGIEVTSAHPMAQSLLAAAYNAEKAPRCLCIAGGVEMYIAKYKDFVIKRRPETGKDHSPSCISYEPPAGESGLGEALGEAIVELGAELIEVRLDFPLTRRLGRAYTPGERMEKTEVEVARRRLGLRGLQHLLWDRAGTSKYGKNGQGIHL